ncbi:CaiB/BaiF CoA transferase family protein [Microbaculum marinisediminis]|uniref:CoA transferase n=1 Tax=Microbaculum marinisediminis TaxID=2931392 RepID=A0AAW5R0Q5_9HYPH|nr:CoA transferase [Microbaculum sp. A6E488]MCT8973851.1 CoA transferase [Microbaculum sp. A6E488]
MDGALEGIVVVALEQAVAAPLATCRLADAGARVIKLERAEGDFARGYDDAVLGESSYFVWINRGKESCRVDLKRDDDMALVAAMLAKADVFVQNLAPGAAERLGLGAAALRARHPRLTVCDISGYAPDTPDYRRKAYDLLIQADVGLSAITGTPDGGPSRVGISIVDIATGQAAHAAILEALLRRGRTGEGSHIQISLFDTIAELMNVPYLQARYGGKAPKRAGLAHPSIAPYGVFRLKDGDIVLAVQTDNEWTVLCADVLRRPDLAQDPRFGTNVSRVRHRAAVDAAVQGSLDAWTFAALNEALDRARIAYGRLSSLADLIAHRSVAKMSVAVTGGNAEVLAPAAFVNGERPTLRPVPKLGEHDAPLRAEFAPTNRRK